MTTIMATHASPAAPAEAGAAQAARAPYRVTGRRVLRSEWSKLWSLRSTWITLGLGLVFMVGFGLIAAVQFKSRISSGQHIDADFAKATAVSLSLFGTSFAQLALGVLGVLVTVGEYSTGMIRSTLAAVPRRLPVLWSKSAVFGVVALVVGITGAFITFLFASGIVSGTPAALTLGDAGVLRSLLGAGLYLGLVGVIGTALGSLLRSVAAGISVLVGALMLVPGLISLLPSAWQNGISPYLPSHAGESMFALHHAANTLTPTAGLAVFLGWTVLALAGAAYRLVHTDA
jgi:ABC-2 type transport system permease protein